MGNGAVHAQSPTATGAAPKSVDPPGDARPPARGAAAFDQGQAAWGRGDFDVAEAQLREAIEKGGLGRKDFLKAYIYLGSARAVLNKPQHAAAAFRIAASLDPSFRVPSEAGKKAARVAEAARRQRFPAPSIRAEAPSEIPPGRPFRVEVSLVSHPARTAGPSALVLLRAALHVSDGLTNGYTIDQAAGGHVSFDVPEKMATEGAHLFVRASGLDDHGNELVASEIQVHVTGAAPGEVAQKGPIPLAPEAVPPPPAPVAKMPRAGVIDARFSAPPPAADKADKDRGASSKGFWSTPWPYILGGAVLAGAGAGAYFLLRPSDQVTVTPVQVQSLQAQASP
ncbi:hypothetical protein [Pendulispora albinea]|uniref:Tetratricopeptide repeat protein n=1 Tax=Pendulispora albinea TaxID=2741071 RepID=A0ABZ2M2I6_9BACT